MRLLRWLVVTELRGWRSLFFLLTRRVPGRGPGVVTFGYAKELGPIIGAFIFGSALELVVVHLLLPWETIRLIADILSLWGLLWMVGYLANVLVYPHLLGPDALRVRFGPAVDLRIPWDAVAEVKARRRSATEEDGVRTVPVLNRTKVDVKLHDATEVRLFVDDTKGFVAACGQFIAQHASN
jgi:hypothetical protein